MGWTSVKDEALPRVWKLAQIMGVTDREALGTVTMLWRESQDVLALSGSVEDIIDWAHLYTEPEEDQARWLRGMVRSRIISPEEPENPATHYRIHGNDSEIAKTIEYRESRRRGGLARAQAAARAGGKFVKADQAADYPVDNYQLKNSIIGEKRPETDGRPRASALEEPAPASAPAEHQHPTSISPACDQHKHQLSTSIRPASAPAEHQVPPANSTQLNSTQDLKTRSCASDAMDTSPEPAVGGLESDGDHHDHRPGPGPEDEPGPTASGWDEGPEPSTEAVVDTDELPGLEPEAPQSPTRSRPRLDFEALYAQYPRRKGKSEGLSRLKARIKTPEAYQRVAEGIRAYADECRREKREERFIEYFSRWVNREGWRDYEDPLPKVRSSQVYDFGDDIVSQMDTAFGPVKLSRESWERWDREYRAGKTPTPPPPLQSPKGADP